MPPFNSGISGIHKSFNTIILLPLVITISGWGPNLTFQLHFIVISAGTMSLVCYCDHRLVSLSSHTIHMCGLGHELFWKLTLNSRP